MAILEIKNLKKQFGNLEIIDNLNLSVRKGEFLVLFGPNGCGKTTFLRLIANLIKPSSGKIRLGNKNKSCRIGFVFQEDRLLPWKTVFENIDIVAKNFFRDEKQRKKIIKKYLDVVGLNSFANYYPNKLSGGMKQKVALVRALVIEPEIILMDEPFRALDIHSKIKFQKEILKIWRKTGKTIIFVTHDIQEALRMAQKLVLLSERPSKVLNIFTNMDEQDKIRKKLEVIAY